MSAAPQQTAGGKRLLTTVEIQQMLEENSKLIAAIAENQNLGKLEECIEYQKRLQQNLMSLAALADSQATPQQQQQQQQQAALPGQQPGLVQPGGRM